MYKNKVKVKRALISVSDKTGLVEFAKLLTKLDIEIISTGGTCQLLRQANIPVTEVSEVTQFPEMMEGRVKTLHPKVHGGILGRRDKHAEIAKQHDIEWIDLIVVNLYPFVETISRENVTFDEAIENIDIGGPAMIRSAAKNMEWVGVVVDPLDYVKVGKVLEEEGGLSAELRRNLATKAFQHTSEYDFAIQNYLNQETLASQNADQPHGFEDAMTLRLQKFSDLRYGENPHQKAAAYRIANHEGILSAKQYQGKQLSYNNITDADAAVACVREFGQPACVIVKHANPCGAAVADDIGKAFQRAYEADKQSAFGGIVALNRTCTKKIAEALADVFIEVLIAPAYEEEALLLFAKKPNVRVLELALEQPASSCALKFVQGGVLIQDDDLSLITQNNLDIVTKRQPTVIEMNAMLFAWPVLKHIKSNAILIARDDATLGVGAGQVSRVDAVHIAIRKAGAHLNGAVLASDAFFPFRDSIDEIAQTGIQAIIQPGGSMRDIEVIAACDEHDIAMVFTGQRCFKH